MILYNQHMQQFILDHMDQIAGIQLPTKPNYEVTVQQNGEAIDPETGEVFAHPESDEIT